MKRPEKMRGLGRQPVRLPRDLKLPRSGRDSKQAWRRSPLESVR
jgi:hypothetical protein